jgi:hypothetical protein
MHGFDNGTTGSFYNPVRHSDGFFLEFSVVGIFRPVRIPEQIVQVDDRDSQTFPEPFGDGGFAGSGGAGDIDSHKGSGCANGVVYDGVLTQDNRFPVFSNDVGNTGEFSRGDIGVSKRQSDVALVKNEALEAIP